MKLPSFLSVAFFATAMPLLSVNVRIGSPCNDSGPCGDEQTNTTSWSWQLNIGKTEFKTDNDLLSYSRSGALEGSLRGNQVRTFDQVFSNYNGGSSSKQNLALTFDKKKVTAAIADPAVLTLGADNTPAEVIKNAGVIRQVLTDSVFTDVSPLPSGAGYTVRTWSITSIPPLAKTNGLYNIPAQPAFAPYYSFTFSNPDHPADNHKIDKTTVETSGNSTRTITERYEETFLPVPDETIPDTFTISTYAGPDTTGTLLRREVIQYSDRGTGTTTGPASANGTRRYWDYNLDRTISEAELSPTGALGPLRVISRTYEQFADFTVYTGTTEPDPGGAKGARRMVSLTEGYMSAEPRTTTYAYVNDPSNPHTHGRMKSTTGPDGSWEYYEYSDSQNASLAVETKWSSWKNESVANKENARKTVTSIEKSKTTSVTTIAGQTVAMSETILETLPGGELLTTSRAWDGAEWHDTLACRHPQNNNALTTGRVKWIENADGTATTRTFAAAPGGYTITESSGAGDRTGITDGTRTVGTYNIEHTLLASSSFDIASGLQLDAWVASDLDNKGRPQRTDHPLDGTHSISQYSCCGIGFSRNRSGATMTYSRDPLKRTYRVVAKRSSTGPGVATTTHYNGLATIGSQTGGATTLLLSESTTNLAGETILIKSPDANGDNTPETTTMVTTYPAGGGKTTTTTHPDNSTSISTSFADGQPASLFGTSTTHMTYDHGTHALNGGGTWSQAIMANGTEWTKSYTDSIDRSFLTEMADGATAETTYHPFTAAKGSRGKTSSTVDPDGVTTIYAYDAEADLSQTNEQMPAAQQRITLIDNDVVNDPDIGISARSATTVNGILVSTSLSQTIGYASKSVTLSVTSTSIRTVPNDGAWTVTSTAPDGTQQLQQYTDGLLTSSSSLLTDHSALITISSSHDAFGRTLTQTDSRTGTTTMGTILENGSYASVTDPGNRTTAFTYDVMGRTLTTDLPDTLDAEGNTLTNITENSYTLRGETAATWGAQTNPTFNIYDSQGRMSELRTYKALIGEPTAATPDSASTTWIYSPQRGFLTAKRDAENKGATYTYTPAGRLATRTWARGIVTTYTYDAGMLTLTDYSDTTPDVTATYDNFGRVLSSSTLITSSTFAYDPAILVLDTETVSHDLDADGTPELTRVIDRTQDNLLRSTGFTLGAPTSVGVFEQSTSYAYSLTTGRLETVSGGGLNPPSQFTYNYLANSNLTESITGPAHTVTNAWDPTRNVLLSKENKAGATVVSDYSYTVNSLGQRTDVSQTGTAFAATRSIAWGYDSLGQVVKADSTVPGLDRAYQYDLIGNRIKSADSLTLPADANYITNSLNQYSAIQNPQSAILNASYDDDGNATTYPLPANLTSNSTLTWDAENRMISSAVGATTTTYLYDAASRRIAKTTNGATTLYIYDGWNPIAQWTADLQSASSLILKETYLWGSDLSGSMQGAGGVGGLLLITDHSALANFFPTYDGNGNVSEYLNSTGAVAAHYEYDPFGRTTVATGAKAQDFSHRFSTKPLDSETGLYYYGYRYYDPTTGRWPSKDPIGEMGGLNLYAFVGNDGVNRLDYLGLAVGSSQYSKLEKSWEEWTYSFIFLSFSESKCECEYAVTTSKLKKEQFQKYYIHYTTDASADALIAAILAFDPTPFADIISAIRSSSASATDPVPDGAEIYDISRSTGSPQIRTSYISGSTYFGVRHIVPAYSEGECEDIPDQIRKRNEQTH